MSPPPEKERSFFGIKPLHASGLAAVVFTLATQNLAQEIAGGLAIKLQRHVDVGDEVRLGDGTSGLIDSMGWTSTSIRGYNDLVIMIPNSQLLHERVTNISKAKRSQVKQVLRFHHKDIKQVRALLKAIKDETKTSCPELITDGTAIYRAVITSLESDHVQAQVDFCFEIPAETEAASRNRQEVLHTIARVAQEHGVEFALPTVRTDAIV